MSQLMAIVYLLVNQCLNVSQHEVKNHPIACELMCVNAIY